ncbi:phosphodiester glycosidase family protein [Massilia pseudoviolaceinigra]|uniref:phosphodiester glycosidase family protein n=1 Tax=Massilia pseudoviolaceinigra TaxID=3057165 RepID=UPI00279652BF|nr:phosphodiester glycosidase family protein [Massilia sp. CCM 9206]MDQ1924165.1 phosphodiester glycosidase family protein [Massilia sp. CCM 9206]
MKKLLFSLLVCLSAQLCQAADTRFTVVTVDPARQDLRLFLNDETGQPFKGFGRLQDWLRERKQRLVFAVNAGMYHPGFAPVGLHVENGKELAPLNLDDGKGNFFLKPNGVFFLTRTGPQVLESTAYAAQAAQVRLATQSGPMLVIDGRMHPRFEADSRSRHVRNGVGVLDGKAIFVISNVPVTLHEFATYFRDTLHCKNALYLDGSISSLFSTELGRADFGPPLGPILGVVEPVPR